MAKEKKSPWLAISVGCCASERRESIDEDGRGDVLKAVGMFTFDSSLLPGALLFKDNHCSINTDIVWTLSLTPTTTSLDHVFFFGVLVAFPFLLTRNQPLAIPP